VGVAVFMRFFLNVDALRWVVDRRSLCEIVRYDRLSRFDNIFLDPVYLLFDQRPIIGIPFIGGHLHIGITNL
jgi:hypothetical protein